MVDSSDPTPLPPEPTTACRGLSLAGLVLIVVFLTTVATVAFPVRLLNPAWQLRLGGMLINMAPMPLIGLGLLHLAVLLDPLDPLLMRRLRPAAHLGVLVALGYLLLAPLLGNAALAQLRDQVSVRDARLRQASFHLEQLRQAVSAASSVPDLEARMNALQGPKLDSADRLQPLPRLRTRAYALLDQASEQLSRAKANATPINPWVLLPAIARNSVASLALALGFAGLAQRPGSEISLLAELVDRFELSVLRRRISRDNRAGTLSDQDYVAQLTDEPE
ncbi:MAG: HpsJ family protein [Synechococcaceae cyanobacterium]